MSNFSKNKPGSQIDAAFTHHHVYEVADSLSDSKHIADDYNSAHRYQHRASVTVVGYPDIRPYDPIYLDGLPNGLSGYWTVISVRHVFNGRLANYTLDLEVGTDLIGDTDPNAAANYSSRDVQSDLAEQSLSASDVVLTSYEVSPNISPVVSTTGDASITAIGDLSNVAIPYVPGSTPFKDAPPNTNFLKSKVQWNSETNGRIIK